MDLALFDFDGTITRRDTFAPFIRLVAGWRRVASGALWLSPLIAAYALGWLPATKLRAALVYRALRGRGEREVSALGVRYEQTLASVMRPEALEKIRWHKERGDRVVVVSASLHPYLRAWCERQRLELICTELECRDGVLTGRYLGGDCTGREKARRVSARYDLARYGAVHAYGDTHEDLELLALASKRYFRWRELAAQG